MTASQANRASKYLEFLDIDSVAESWQKAWHSAVVMGLCQSKLDKMQQKAKLVVPKARRTRADYVVPVLLDPNTMRVLQDPERHIQYRAALEQAAEESNRMERKAMRPSKEQPRTATELGLDVWNLQRNGAIPMPVPGMSTQFGAMPGGGC